LKSNCNGFWILLLVTISHCNSSIVSSFILHWVDLVIGVVVELEARMRCYVVGLSTVFQLYGHLNINKQRE